jgi:hypothetical protein
MCLFHPPALETINESQLTRYTSYCAIQDILVVAYSTSDISLPSNFGIPSLRRYMPVTMTGFTAVNKPRKSAQAVRVGPIAAVVPSTTTQGLQKIASTQPKNPRKRKAPSLESNSATTQQGLRPLRALAPKPPSPPTKSPRRDSIIEDGNKPIALNLSFASGPLSGPTSGPISRHVQVRSRSTKPQTSTSILTPDGQNELVSSSPHSQSVVDDLIQSHVQTEDGVTDREARDLRKGLHEGRDPYGLASKTYLHMGLPLRWGCCEACEEEKDANKEI